jgi:uncharacterized membrane protein YagU involved in acid resistance
MNSSSRPLRAILVGGLIAGALDITFACVASSFKGVDAMTILQSVASGLLGARAYEGGSGTAVLGLILHFAMMLIIAAIFVFMRRHGPQIVRERPALVGPLYGVAVYFVMNRVVIPLSAFPMKVDYIPASFLSLAAHMFFIGWVIAWAAAKFDGAALISETARSRSPAGGR